MGQAQVIPCPVCQGHPRLATIVSNSTVSSNLSWATSSPQVAAALVHCAAKGPEAFVPHWEKQRDGPVLSQGDGVGDGGTLVVNPPLLLGE